MDCLSSCFGKTRENDDPERDPLLPKHSRNGITNGSVPSLGDGPTSAPPLGPSVVDKVIDAITAIKAGKLPSQSQVEHVFNALIASDFLQDEGGPTMAGNGPFSKQGRKVLADVREVVQALLEFGLEKNADDKIQETYFQLLQLTSQSQNHHSSTIAQKATPEEDTPLDQQIAFDAQTFIHAIRTLLGTALTSTTFRILILDFLAIINGLMEAAAKDVKRAAGRVQKVAEDMENRARGDHDVIDDSVSQGETSTKDLKQKGQAIIDKAQDATKDLRDELGEQAQEATDDAKERLLARIRQLLSRLQKDPSSRAAMRSLVTLFQKYSASLSTITDESKSSAKQMSSDITDVLEDSSKATYPPAPYVQNPQRESQGLIPSEIVLANLKELLERLARRHSLDPLLAALRRVFVSLHEDVPKAIRTELAETIEQHVEEPKPEKAKSTPALTPIQTHPPFSEQLKGKGKSRKAARKAKKRGQRRERSEQETPVSPSESHQGVTPAESQNFPSSAEDSSREPNAVSLYFTRLGDYFNKALEEPDWATSGAGSRTLEALFDDGVYLINVVGESIVEVGDKATTTAHSSDNEHSRGTSEADDDEKDRQTSDRENDRIRRQFKADLHTLVREAEDYISALQTDRATMKVWDAWQALGEDGKRLVTVGGRRAYGYMHSLSPWTEWIGWAVPRLLKVLPLSALPIPTVEFKTPSIEGALHALFVQGLARGKDVGQGSLIPDELVVKEFTELRLNMVDRPLHSSMPMSEVPTGTLHKPNFDAAARLHLHANGIRAKIERVGYYFKYTGTVFGYEDQGVLTADLAIDSPHEGFGVDIELEMNGSKTAQPQSPNVPEIIVEGEGGEVAERSIPITDSADVLAQGPPKPLFNVLDVQVMIRGLKVSLDQSKHWILNKVFFQPAAGPAIATALQMALEGQIHAKLQSLSLSLGEVVQEASRRNELRKLRSQGQGEGSQDSALDVLGDFWAAVVEVGPHAFGFDDNQKNQQTESTLDTTSQGLIYTSRQVVAEQPRGTPSMAVDPSTGATTKVDLTMKDIGGSDQRIAEGEETVVAIGLGGQLFPGKVDETASYGATEDRERDPLGSRLSEGMSEAQNMTGHIGDRWVESSQCENSSKKTTWRSKAFDLGH